MPPSRSKSKKTTPVDIPVEEQWRLINESGVLKGTLKKVDTPTDEEVGLGEEIFNASLLIIPCSFLLLLMQILIYNQYGQEVNLKMLVDRIIEGIPILSIFIFYTTRHKRNPRVQLLLFLIGSAVGSRMLFLLTRAGYLVNMRQCPPLVTLWVYIVIQLDLGLAVLNLMLVGAFCWWKGLDLFK